MYLSSSVKTFLTIDQVLSTKIDRVRHNLGSIVCFR